MTDAHCHCHWEVFKDKDAYPRIGTNADIALNPRIDISADIGFCSYAINEQDWQRLANYNCKFKAYGLHPWHSSESLDNLESYLEGAVALGEIGLDYIKGTSPKEIQREKFRAQLALAKEKSLPICIHSVGATKDTLAILDEDFKGRAGQILFHFANFIPTGKVYVKESFFSFSKKSLAMKKSLALLDILGLDNILIETDSACDKADLNFCLERISLLKNIEAQELELIVDDNFKRFYSL